MHGISYVYKQAGMGSWEYMAIKKPPGGGKSEEWMCGANEIETEVEIEGNGGLEKVAEG